MDKIKKVIEPSWKGKNQGFVIAGIFLIGSFLIFITLKTLPIFLIVMGIVLLIVAFLNQGLKIFQFYEKHFTFQPSIAIKKMILYDNVETFEIQKRKIIISYKEEGTTKKIQYLKERINTKDLTYLENFFSDKIKN